MIRRQSLTLLLWFLSALMSNKTLSSCSGTNEKVSVLVPDGNLFERSYSLEDFFWTGSGDGPVLEDSFFNETSDKPSLNQNSYETWRTTTVFHTTTIIFATVYPSTENCSRSNCKPRISPVWTGSVEFSSPPNPTPLFYGIQPTPSLKYPNASEKLKNITVFSEITKIVTVTERFTARDDLLVTPAMTPLDHSFTQSIAHKNYTDGPKKTDIDDKNKKHGGAAFPRFDMESSSTTSTIELKIPLDQRYWLLTVLKRDSSSPELRASLLEQKLAVLYKKAFMRQQEKHLGINNSSVTTFRPRRDKGIPEPVKVHIHNVSDTMSDDPNEIGLIYSVTVAGKPVPALTAANDMKLLSVNEVVAELGYPVLTKAEPFLKVAAPLGSRIKGRTRDTWLLIGSVIAAVALLIVLAALFTFGLSHNRSNRNSARSTNNKKHIFEAEEGSSNVAFEEDNDLKLKSTALKHHSSKFDGLKAAENLGSTTVTFADQRRESSSSSSCSGSSEASLVRLRHQQKKRDHRKELSEEKARPKPKTRVRRVQNADSALGDAHTGRVGSGSAVSRDRDSLGGMTTEGLDDVELTPRITRTPTSYLSMPSVKAFPRGAKIPEPLSRVLEPISIRHLDGESDNIPRQLHRSKPVDDDCETHCLEETELKTGKGMTRHASLESDPGVIGPIVWKKHCLKTNNMKTDVVDVTEIDGNQNIGKMRRRFNDLIDDAFNMFGSRYENPEGRENLGTEPTPMRPPVSRIHSAVARPAESFYPSRSVGRPKTTDSKRVLAAINQGPRDAWDSPCYKTPLKSVVTSTLTIDKDSVLVDSNLPPGDPAISLIKAIKDELQKFDQPSFKCADNS